MLHEHLSGALIDTDVLVIKTVGFDFSTCPLPKKIASVLPQRNVPLGLGIENDFVVFSDYGGIFVCVCQLQHDSPCLIVFDCRSFLHVS